MPSSIERKLAAIMFTDIAGFTALSGKDETKALSLLDKQKEVIVPILDEFNGTLHKEMGDGLLFTFSTVTEAVKCAIKIQEVTKSVDELNLRIGIHEGEITFKDGDVLGDDVNVASRIEPFAPLGGIAISGKVQQNISSLPEFQTDFVGNPSLKGVSQDVKVYCITSHGLPLPNKSKISAKLEEQAKPRFNIFALTGAILTVTGIGFWIAVGVFGLSFGTKYEVPSVGILMMENLGSEEDNFWARGITGDLIIKVASSGNIRVPSIKEIVEVDISETFEKIAERLNVKYILTSELYKDENKFDGKILDAGYTLKGMHYVHVTDPLGVFKNYKISQDPGAYYLFEFNSENINLMPTKLYAKSLEDFIEVSYEYELNYISINKNGVNDVYYPYLNEIYENEEKFPYLVKVFDTEQEEFEKLKAKVFEIDYKEFYHLNG